MFKEYNIVIVLFVTNRLCYFRTEQVKLHVACKASKCLRSFMYILYTPLIYSYMSPTCC